MIKPMKILDEDWRSVSNSGCFLTVFLETIDNFYLTKKNIINNPKGAQWVPGLLVYEY